MQKAVLVAGGVLNGAFVAFHAGFWRLRKLNWRVELPRMNAANRGAIQVMNIMLIYVFACFAGVSFVMAATGAPQAMLNAFSIVIGGFYVVRAALQFVFFETTPLGLAIVGVCVLAAASYFAAMM